MLRVVLLALVMAGSITPFSEEPWTTGNRFAAEYGVWVKSRNAHVEGTISAAEVLQWQRTKSAWRKLEKQIDSEYRGDAVRSVR